MGEGGLDLRRVRLFCGRGRCSEGVGVVGSEP